MEKVLVSKILVSYERKRVKLMRLPTMLAIKTLEQFDWSQTASASKPQDLELVHLTFTERAEDVLMPGQSDVGKTHLAMMLCY